LIGKRPREIEEEKKEPLKTQQNSSNKRDQKESEKFKDILGDQLLQQVNI